MRAKMPVCAAFVDDLRAAFGTEDINNVIKRGLRPDAKPAHRVHFVEAGHELGRGYVPEGVEVMPTLRAPVVVATGKRGRS